MQCTPIFFWLCASARIMPNGIKSSDGIADIEWTFIAVRKIYWHWHCERLGNA
jgi:hypothetical protein